MRDLTLAPPPRPRTPFGPCRRKSSGADPVECGGPLAQSISPASKGGPKVFCERCGATDDELTQKLREEFSAVPPPAPVSDLFPPPPPHPSLSDWQATFAGISPAEGGPQLVLRGPVRLPLDDGELLAFLDESMTASVKAFADGDAAKLAARHQQQLADAVTEAKSALAEAQALREQVAGGVRDGAEPKKLEKLEGQFSAALTRAERLAERPAILLPLAAQSAIAARAAAVAAVRAALRDTEAVLRQRKKDELQKVSDMVRGPLSVLLALDRALIAARDMSGTTSSDPDRALANVAGNRWGLALVEPQPIT